MAEQTFSKEWCINMARQEVGQDIGAGVMAMDPSLSNKAGSDPETQERIAAWLEQYPTPMNDLDMAMRIRDICAAIRNGSYLK